LPLLRSVAKAGGFEPEAACEAYFSFFSKYEDKDRVPRGRLNHAPKEWTKSRQEGKSWAECSQDDVQAQGIAKVPILVARYAGTGELIPKVEQHTKILQSTEISVMSSRLLARILEHMLLSGDNVLKAMNHVLANLGDTDISEKNILKIVLSDDLIFEWKTITDRIALLSENPEDKDQKVRVERTLFRNYVAKGSLPAAFEALQPADQAYAAKIDYPGTPIPATTPLTTNQVLKSFGLSCVLPGVLMGSFYIARKYLSLEEGVIANILAGGDNCSRGMVVAALLSNVGGSISADWTEEANPELLAEITELSDKIANDNTHFAKL